MVYKRKVMSERKRFEWKPYFGTSRDVVLRIIEVIKIAVTNEMTGGDAR
ncbi:MAG: hypothetical protein WBA22_14445 [Candidatus Methanofastidiosia archaeon]